MPGIQELESAAKQIVFSHTAPVSALPGMSASRKPALTQLYELAAQSQALKNLAVAI